MHYRDQSRNVCEVRSKWTDWNATEVNTAKEQFAEGFSCRQNLALVISRFVVIVLLLVFTPNNRQVHRNVGSIPLKPLEFQMAGKTKEVLQVSAKGRTN